MQTWASGSHLLIGVSSWLYVNAQTTVTVGALVYLYLCHNRSFYFVRNMLVISMAIALVAYAVFPTAPPRFMPEWGFFDPVGDFTGVRLETAHGGGGTTTALTNIYAAVPSMHVAFALLIGWPLARLVRWRALRVLWLRVPVPDGVRDHGDRQPLHPRRAVRRADRRRLRLRRALAGARAARGVALLAGDARGSGRRAPARRLASPRCTPAVPPDSDVYEP